MSLHIRKDNHSVRDDKDEDECEMVRENIMSSSNYMREIA